MAHPQTAPCVNINDEVVQVVRIDVSEGALVKGGDVIAAVETDKSLVDVIAERDGYVLKIMCLPEQKLPVGAVMLWLGDAPDEQIPEAAPTAIPGSGAGGPPTAKARAMLKALGLDPTEIPVAGERLTVGDIEAWLATSGGGRRAIPAPSENAASRRGTAVGRRRAAGTLRRSGGDAAHRTLASRRGGARLPGTRVRPQAVGRVRRTLRRRSTSCCCRRCCR